MVIDFHKNKHTHIKIITCLWLFFAEKVAGELSDALTAAFDLGTAADSGQDSYKFDEHF